jgi:hypothetical protein
MSQSDNNAITRASFLRGLGVAGLGAAGFAGSANAQRVSPSGEMTLNFHFSGDSYRVNTSQQSGGPYTDRLVFAGSGQIVGKFQVGTPVNQGFVNARGSFAHYDKGSPPGNNIPLQFVGTWESTDLVSFQLLGLYGTDAAGAYPLAAGVLVLDIVLVRPATSLIPLTRVPSQLTLVSNLPPSGAPTSGKPDGVTLLAPNDPANGFFFVPIPVISTTPPGIGEARTTVLFSTLNERRNQP